ncbi:MAG: FAD-dependent oxidoreductase, partial [Bacteroidetes bacterium]|nr:FAD-dependent oxidoreductase [Bacteroidota bacterium]
MRTAASALLASPFALSGCSSDGLTADVVIIGAGTGGVAAALAAAERGLSVVLTDEMPLPGGQL